jgi:hypothetical protein
VVADAVVYVPFIAGIGAYDATGTTNCSGSPKTCTELGGVVPAGDPSDPAVSNGVLYVGTGKYGRPGFGENTLQAFGLEKIRPTTSIVIPSNGATLSGTQAQLDASASDNVSVSRVEFHLTGGSYNDTLIGVATMYPGYGYIYYWDTTAVPNGPYTLNSVAYDPAGNVGRSANVTITVKN